MTDGSEPRNRLTILRAHHPAFDQHHYHPELFTLAQVLLDQRRPLNPFGFRNFRIAITRKIREHETREGLVVGGDRKQIDRTGFTRRAADLCQSFALQQ